MSVVSFFEKFLGLQQEKAKATIASYRELVAGIATGEEPNTAEVERLLAGAGKSIDDLQQDVHHYRHRFALKAMLASLPGLEEERRQVDEQLATATRLLDEAEKVHDETTAPLYERRRELDRAIGDASRASSDLLQSCEDADLHRELAEVNTEARRLEEQHRDLIDRARYLDGQAEFALERANREISLDKGASRREAAERHQKDAEAARREARRLEAQRPDLDKRRKEIEERMRLA